MRQEKWRSFKFERDSIAKSTDKTDRGSHVGKIRLKYRLNIWSASRFLYWRHTGTHFLLPEVKETTTSSPSSRYPLLDLEGLEETSVCGDMSSKNTLHSLWPRSYKIWTIWRPREIAIVFLLYCFLGAFAKLGWATISFVVSVRLSFRPSVRIEQLGSR